MNINNIPDRLKTDALWCLWRGNKIPYNPHTGGKAQSNNPATFADFYTAYDAYSKGGYDGLGIGIFGNVGAIDIDNCVEDGALSPVALDIINKTGSYAEISPGGMGVRIVFTLDEGFVYDKSLYYVNNQKAGIEVYISGATSRYVTITGNALNDSPVVDVTARLQGVLDAYMKRDIVLKVAGTGVAAVGGSSVSGNATAVALASPATGNVPAAASLSSPAAVPASTMTAYAIPSWLKVGLRRDRKLRDYWYGARPLKSESENDAGFLAKLLFWCHGDVVEAERAFLGSPYVGQKGWYHREKLRRRDYLVRTMGFVLDSGIVRYRKG
jgi:putative DNA primase/helicase